MKTKIIAIIQARLGSIRLPNKVLLQIPPNSGVSMLEMVVRKAMLATKVNEVCVVTPDLFISKMCSRWGIMAYMPYWKGRDVLREFYFAAQHNNLHFEGRDAIVRLTADCPMLDPEIIDKCVEKFLESDVDLVYNSIDETGFADGQDVEVFNYITLAKALTQAKDEQDREHVTRYIRRNMRCLHAPYGDNSTLSVNTREDYEKICRLINSY